MDELELNLIYRKVMLMKYLFTGFQDNTNSSKQLAMQLGKAVDASEVLILTNDREMCVKQLYAILESHHFDSILMFGQKPVIRDKIYLERQARVDGKLLVTDFDLGSIAGYLTRQDNVIKESDNPGTSFCNWIYYHALKYVREFHLTTRVLLIHIPNLGNTTNLNKLVADFSQALSHIETNSCDNDFFYIDNPRNENISTLLDELSTPS